MRLLILPSDKCSKSHILAQELTEAMSYPDNTHIAAQDLMFKGVLNDIKKSRESLQPIFEAFTNAIEAIKIKSEIHPDFKGKIEIKINARETTTELSEFSSLSITDNGVGFDDKEFKRFNTWKDISKGFKNLGSGRIQYAHYFDNTTFISTFFSEDKCFQREFVVSKKQSFLDHNAIVYHTSCLEKVSTESGTTISFNTLLENSPIYHTLNENNLKEKLIERYIHYFCYNKSSLPEIEIKFYIQSVLSGEQTITQNDIPDFNKTNIVPLHYSKISADAKLIEKLEKTIDFKIDAFKIKKEVLKTNDLKLVSKGEIVEDSKITLQGLAEADNVKGFKFLFLVSSDYIDSRDSNIRGELNIPDRDTFSKSGFFFNQEEILIEDIQDKVNESINKMYPEIEEVKKNHDEQLQKLKEMFLLDDESIKNINLSINDSETKILEKFYEAEAKKEAAVDASIKKSIDKLNSLNTTADNYAEELQKEIETLVKVIPQQNRIALTHYVARRKLVLELFDKILQKQLLIQNTSERNIDEKLLHNLIFQQTVTNSEDSDLWLVNEDFIYFEGSSESVLKDIKVKGENLLRDNLTKEEEKFRTSLSENRFIKRPDILLFPDEGKCIIIEFKNPEVNVAEHLTQINNYAALIWNFAKPEYRFNTFYGYLIGEQIEANDVRAHDGDFKEAYQFDYLVRTHKSIPGFFVSGDASLYTEVIKYSTLLQRARRRNDIFIKKLTK